ncbi:hypothetical protein [Caldilinea sp.]|uniref:hypothetical protein n=1 Tax=Caldilinea sp. TaxID=2293560 RepID=UPI002CEC4D44|nr:hypothetical protein [Caldilinea sp.]HRA67752.1 hypothetical protein [Caldilinea sp.]
MEWGCPALVVWGLPVPVPEQTCMSQASPTSPASPASADLTVTPLNDIERELVRVLLRGLRQLEANDYHVRHDWCRVRRRRRLEDTEFTIELDPARLGIS